MKFEIQTRGVAEAAAHIAQVGARATDVRPVSREIASVVARSNDRRFQTRGQGTWPPLSPDTVERKGSSQPLVDTGRLRRSLAVDPKIEASTDEVRIGTDVEYALFHDHGTSKMPQRRLTDLRPSERREIADKISRHVVAKRL